IGVLALVSFPFAPLGGSTSRIVLQLLSAFALVATLIWAIRRPRDRQLCVRAHPGLAFIVASLVLVGSVPDLLMMPRIRQSWSVIASEQVADGLYAAGYTTPQLFDSMQGPS